VVVDRVGKIVHCLVRTGSIVKADLMGILRKLRRKRSQSVGIVMLDNLKMHHNTDLNRYATR
jgi:hypothetical protein